jgi:hypothetical protein
MKTDLRVLRNFTLHPLIHTFATRNLNTRCCEKKAELKTPHFLNSNQDIVVGSQEEKCGLKYVIFTFAVTHPNTSLLHALVNLLGLDLGGLC